MQTVQTDTSRAATPVIQWCLVKWNAKKKLNVCKEDYLIRIYGTKNYVLLWTYDETQLHEATLAKQQKKFKIWKRLK